MIDKTLANLGAMLEAESAMRVAIAKARNYQPSLYLDKPCKDRGQKKQHCVCVYGGEE